MLADESFKGEHHQETGQLNRNLKRRKLVNNESELDIVLKYLQIDKVIVEHEIRT